jgi:hypothetical protein
MLQSFKSELNYRRFHRNGSNTPGFPLQGAGARTSVAAAGGTDPPAPRRYLAALEQHPLNSPRGHGRILLVLSTEKAGGRYAADLVLAAAGPSSGSAASLKSPPWCWCPMVITSSFVAVLAAIISECKLS